MRQFSKAHAATAEMNLNNKVTLLFSAIAALLLAVLIAISLYAFRSFSIASATEHLLTSAEIVRVHLTESMINGVIDKRERFLQRLTEVHGLRSARVVRSPEVSKQFGEGLNLETAADDIERAVLAKANPASSWLPTRANPSIAAPFPISPRSAATPTASSATR